METSNLPALNAFLNSCSTICLILGFFSIKKGKVETHKKFMGSAFLFSAVFLVSYLYYHYQVGHTVFPHTGMIKTIYLIILIPHIILAALMVPMILATFYYALKGKFDSHKRIAKWTLPIWLYVSFTGIIIYFMLYRWFA
jgi:putative membrane protein